jgi:aminoglycoside 6'-N-acetyltransferase I
MARTSKSRELAIQRCTSVADPSWIIIREQLWPDCSRAHHLIEMAQFVATPDRLATFIATDSHNDPIGIAEVSLRADHVNGTSSSPVGFLEGIYVDPANRRQGVARQLIAAAESWAKSRGCTEFASDTNPENVNSMAMHRSVGFEEADRVVFFRKTLS